MRRWITGFGAAGALMIAFLFLTGADVIRRGVTTVYNLMYRCSGTGCVSRPIASKEGDLLSLMDFGCKGDGATDDTACIQAAVTYANTAVDITTYQNLTPGNGARTEIYCPTGLYKVTDTITVPGIVSLRGDGNELTYGGCRIRQTTCGKHLFQIAGTSATNNASVQFRDLALSSSCSTHAAGTALIYIPSTVTNAASIYIKNNWFQTPEYWAIRIDKGDDVTILDNTFDVTSQRAISLGSATTLATTVIISRNYFFWVQTGIVAAINVSGLQFVGNRVFGNSVNRTGYVVDALNQSPVLGDGIIVDHNVTFYANGLLLTKFNGANVTGNLVRLATGPVVQVGGGGTVGNMLISSNNISGVFTGTSAIDGSGASLTYASLIGNTFGGTDGVGGPGGTAFLMTGASTANNNFQGNTIFGFTTSFNVAGGPNNIETNSTGSGTSAGFTGTGGASGAAGIVGTGTVNNPGGSFTGQGSAGGVSATGGATGSGGTFVGGATSGAGLTGTATAGNSPGGSFTGQGSGAGVNATGGASGAGVVGQGTGAAAGGSFTGGATGHGVDGFGGASGARGVYGQGSSGWEGVVGVGNGGAAGGLFVGGATGPGVTATAGASRGAAVNITSDGNLQLGSSTQANLGTPANGTIVYCSDCNTATACTAGGTGALASRQNGAWKCL